MTDARQHILLVEDDEQLAELIKEYLEDAAFKVSVLNEGTHAVEKILELKPDLAILDLMLPGKDGIAICREVRPHFANAILMLTASTESVDHIIGLEMGADDYIQKPVEPRILLAHVRALLRRPAKVGTVETAPSTEGENDTSISFANVSLNKAQRLVKVKDEVLPLTTPEYDIFLCLAENIGEIQSRDDIFQATKGIEYDGQNRLVDITISQIRQKLAALDAFSEQHLKTIRNKGYLIVNAID